MLTFISITGKNSELWQHEHILQTSRVEPRQLRFSAKPRRHSKMRRSLGRRQPPGNTSSLTARLLKSAPHSQTRTSLRAFRSGCSLAEVPQESQSQSRCQSKRSKVSTCIALELET